MAERPASIISRRCETRSQRRNRIPVTSGSDPSPPRQPTTVTCAAQCSMSQPVPRMGLPPATARPGYDSSRFDVASASTKRARVARSLGDNCSASASRAVTRGEGGCDGDLSDAARLAASRTAPDSAPWGMGVATSSLGFSVNLWGGSNPVSPTINCGLVKVNDSVESCNSPGRAY